MPWNIMDGNSILPCVSFDQEGSVAVPFVLKIIQRVVFLGSASFRLDSFASIKFAVGRESEGMSTLPLVLWSIFCGVDVLSKESCVAESTSPDRLELLSFTCEVTGVLSSSTPTVGRVVWGLGLPAGLRESMMCEAVLGVSDDRFCPSPSAGK